MQKEMQENARQFEGHVPTHELASTDVLFTVIGQMYSSSTSLAHHFERIIVLISSELSILYYTEYVFFNVDLFVLRNAKQDFATV